MHIVKLRGLYSLENKSSDQIKGAVTDRTCSTNWKRRRTAIFFVKRSGLTGSK
jgi:hypothetical protein